MLKMSEDSIVLKLIILKLMQMTKAKGFASISGKAVGTFQGSRNIPGLRILHGKIVFF